MNKKALTTLVGVVAAVAGSLGFLGGQPEQPPTNEVARQQIRVKSLEDRVDRIEARTVAALETIAERLTVLERR